MHRLSDGQARQARNLIMPSLCYTGRLAHKRTDLSSPLHKSLQLTLW